MVGEPVAGLPRATLECGRFQSRSCGPGQPARAICQENCSRKALPPADPAPNYHECERGCAYAQRRGLAGLAHATTRADTIAEHDALCANAEGGPGLRLSLWRIDRAAIQRWLRAC